MSTRSRERRTERATAEEVIAVERQLWEFAKRIDPPAVPEAKLRPGAFLWRIHRTWHALGRGTGGLASRSFRALRDELLQRDPPVRNLQPKLYGSTAVAQPEAEQLIDVMLETWHLERERNGKWRAKPLSHPDSGQAADRQDLEAMRANLLHTLFKSDDYLLLEEPVGVPPETFFEERGQKSKALIIPTRAETLAHLSPSNAYGGFSAGLGPFFDAAMSRKNDGQGIPLLIWILKLGPIRDNSEFHQAFHSISLHSSALTNWYFRISHRRTAERKNIADYWKLIIKHSAFAIYGLPSWSTKNNIEKSIDEKNIDADLCDLDVDFFLPNKLPLVLSNHRIVKRHQRRDFGLTVSLESVSDHSHHGDGELTYWLFPEEPRGELEETAETTGLPVFNAEMSPGSDFDMAFNAVYAAVSNHLGLSSDEASQIAINSLTSMGWKILTVEQLQQTLLVSSNLGEE